MTADYAFYVDEYGGRLDAEAFAESLPAAERQVRWLCGCAEPDSDDEDATAAYKRAVCAAVEAFAEWGEGLVGGLTVGDFAVKPYENKGPSGVQIAIDAAVKELAGTGLTFGGVR